MDNFLEQLLNATYQVYQRKLIAKYDFPPFHSSLVKFGGFQFTHD